MLAEGHKLNTNMKKLLLFFSLVLCLLFAGTVKAEEQPTCEAGSHYDGTYQEQENCERVCTKKFFGFCIKYENQCTTTGSWIGSCVLDEVEEPTEPETPATSTDPIISTSTPEINKDNHETNNYFGTSGGSGDSDYLAVLRSMCKDDQVFYTDWENIPNSDMQIRYLLRDQFGKSIFNGCNPTSEQQIRQIRIIGSDTFGIK